MKVAAWVSGGDRRPHGVIMRYAMRSRHIASVRSAPSGAAPAKGKSPKRRPFISFR
jgi:hypothetical protein